VLDFDSRDDLPQPNGVWDLGSSEASEFAKLAETTYRDVNIGLANQFARYADAIDVDIVKVIEACNSQPYSHIHRPGIAVRTLYPDHLVIYQERPGRCAPLRVRPTGKPSYAGPARRRTATAGCTGPGAGAATAVG
jgi:hypothetical protein